ncbi:NADPH2:quinone reductase [Lipingzhangella halophila]|uniref:NADPH2:quinone reductase n=1 Tax=Lipingzhangella halophila TaxID=1783352 RepID=A0A7W7W2T4_9ACTN|nr:zinc-binding dehydrogenase [Lipingzhangella halophila]MBB4931768.1 NADPH2:quinone reductase [Lipingzhangella halophila]
MRVVRATRFGGSEVLEPGQAPDRVAGPGQAVVRVAAADTLFLDIVIRRGSAGPWGVRPPYVPGAGIAGEVSSVGPGVDAAWVGRRVAVKSGTGGPRPQVETIAQAAARTTPTGGYAEHAVVAEEAMIPVPEALGLREAAALVNDGLTAMLLAEAARVRPGERVLVTPAGGGLGCLLVQLAHAAGARVFAGAGDPRKLELARELGAAVTVDYARPGWTDRLREAAGGAGMDVVLDGVGGEVGRSSFGLAGRGGRFVAFGSPSGGFTAVSAQEAGADEVRVISILDLEWTPADERRLPEQALHAAAEGRIRPVIGQTFPLEKAAEAHAAIEARDVVGKTLLLP